MVEISAFETEQIKAAYSVLKMVFLSVVSMVVEKVESKEMNLEW